LVGHEPAMSRLISTLLTGDGGMAMELKKAGFCKLTIQKLVFGKCACLNWLLTPRQLGRLRKHWTPALRNIFPTVRPSE